MRLFHISLIFIMGILKPVSGCLFIESARRSCAPALLGSQARALSYYSDLALSQAFQPMATQLSKKAALPLAKILATASCRSNTTGPCVIHFIPCLRESPTCHTNPTMYQSYPTMHDFVTKVCAHFCYKMLHCGIFD